MSQNRRTRRSKVPQLLKKFTVSVFVAGTFVAYAIHDRLTNSDGGVALANPNEIAFGGSPTAAPLTGIPAATATSTSTLATAIQPPATATPWTMPPAANTTQPTQPTQTQLPPTPTQLPTDTVTDIPTDTPTTLPTATATKGGLYKNGQYTGIIADAFYGNVQVKVIVSNGKITDVQFLDYPHDRRTSQFINAQATPYLKTETIRAQSDRVNIISGATLTSEAFIQSLQSALNKAAA
ncbi:MAG: FMN-binding protein [Aggregatilineales bacterium]